MKDNNHDIETRMREFARSIDGSIERIEEGIRRASIREQSRWNRFAQSPLLKVAAVLVVAAAILLAVNLHAPLPDGGTVLADVSKRLENVESSVWKWESDRPIGSNSGVEYKSVPDGFRQDFLRGGRLIWQNIADFPTHTYYGIDHRNRVYTRRPLTDQMAEPMRDIWEPKTIVETLLAFGRVVSVDRAKVDGVECFVISYKFVLPDSTWSTTSPPDAVTTISVDIDNLWPVRITSDTGYIDNDGWHPMSHSTFGFEWNTELPDSVFDLSFLEKYEQVSGEKMSELLKNHFSGETGSTNGNR